MKALALIALAVVGGCSGDDVQHASLDHVGFSVPSTWQSTLSSTKTSSTLVWTPAENPRKESITIVNSAIDESLAKSPASLGSLVTRAQGALGRMPELTTTPIASDHGLAGVEVEVSFVPPGQTTRYQRVHAAVLDGNRIVHVLYTAADPDPALKTLKLVIASLQHEEG